MAHSRKRRIRTPTAHEASSTTDALPASTKWHREHGRGTRRDKAAKEQYLSPQEEKVLASHVLRMCENGYPLPVKALGSLALVIRRRRHSTPDDSIKPPGKNWPQGFYRRNPQLKSRRLRAIPWDRHDRSIHAKVNEWFSIIGIELANPLILPENVYNMDETGVILGNLGSLKVLVGKEELRNYRGASSERTLITAVECVSAAGKSLNPLVIWPAATLRNNWTAHETPGWHFACTDSGYTNNAVNLYWVQHVFDPSTRVIANGKPRMLISDGHISHESLEVMTFCFENNIVLCRLPSHTSHKLQPCDVAVFGPLKTAYREQVERLFRGGAGTIGKQHFTLLYNRARAVAVTPRNIRSGWSKAGLFPLNPERVLRTLHPPAPEPEAFDASTALEISTTREPLRTPTSASGLGRMRGTLDEILNGLVDERQKLHLEKVVKAAEQSMANCALLADQNSSLFQQNCEKKVRQAARATIPGPARIMSYEDIIRAKRARAENEDKAKAGRGKRGRKGLSGEIFHNDVIEQGAKSSRTDSVQELIETADAIDETQDVEAPSTPVAPLAPCPGRAPVARMW